MYYKMMYESPLGPMILAASDTALVGAWFEGQKYCYGALQGEVLREEDTPILRKAAHWLDDYFAGRMPAIMTLPLAPQGSEFRRLVWYLLCQIPMARRRPMVIWLNKSKNGRERRCRLRPSAVP